MLWERKKLWFCKILPAMASLLQSTTLLFIFSITLILIPNRHAIPFIVLREKGYRYELIGSDDIATIVYMSGTTGNPKGVMLSHTNLLHQIENLGILGPAKAGDRFLSMLPTWHTYKRDCEYFPDRKFGGSGTMFTGTMLNC
ncbi:uncharacterized protein LOC105783441 isoform X1 [Gossypium raimondii]|uniref:uncharacterized protein LOC105783441 isoform X1 n=1 Tax=Gossypium raimondii TaxID=29730 RepID=UPI00063ABBCC|nr:uncharacterized protein LOC105783441 isoform X1 [Gossypium raimondii]